MNYCDCRQFCCKAILIFRQIIKKNIFPTLTKNLSAGVITLIIKRLSLLALVSMILEFAGFAMSFTHCSTYQFAYSTLRNASY